ncbi:MAG: helix-turn-helix transcriptional regulator [Clostridia bacterium]|nr:helix-turn-helix transcriptional regulator [Clostridia bacterium]
MREDIIKRLFEEIKSSNLTYTEIAHRSGISVVMLSQYKNNKKLPSLETFTKICIAIGSSADYILGLKDY